MLGQFELCLYSNSFDSQQHLALIMGSVRDQSEVVVRVHSECFTGEVLRSQRCDCGPQLDRALQAIAQVGRGVLIYLRQEGRGIGLLDKLRAYNLQDQGYDTVEANLLLGHQPDERDYRVAAAILRELEVRSVRLLTNNPQKVESLVLAGIPVIERLALQTGQTPENASYLRTKVRRMHHLLVLPQPEEGAAQLPDPGRDGRPA
jgi:GTP cyclohydrolase II